jgi:hypothetical protein
MKPSEPQGSAGATPPPEEPTGSGDGPQSSLSSTQSADGMGTPEWQGPKWSSVVGLGILFLIDVVVSFVAGGCSIEDGCSAARQTSHEHAALIVAIVGVIALLIAAAVRGRATHAVFVLFLTLGPLLLTAGLFVFLGSSV